MASWTVTPSDDGGEWEIRKDGDLIDTTRSRYDAWEVLTQAEQHAGRPLSWRLTNDGGFVSAGEG